MRARLQVVTAPTSEPISVATAAEWLRADPDLEQARIETAIAAAKSFIETVTGQRFGSQTVKIWLPDFPCPAYRFPAAPISAITSMNWYSTADTATAVSSSLYYFRASDQPPYLSRVVLKDGMDWPTVTLRPIEGIEITATAGHAVTPPLLKLAMLQLIGHYFSNPSATIVVDRAQASAVEIPHGAMAILQGFRLHED